MKFFKSKLTVYSKTYLVETFYFKIFKLTSLEGQYKMFYIIS